MTSTIPNLREEDAFRLRSRTLGDLLKTTLPVRQPLLDGLLREGESMLLWAATGVGKTMAALSMALAMAGGGQFLGWPAPTPRRVLYIDGEMHIGDLQDRLRDLMRAVPGLDTSAACENLVLLARQDQDPTADFPDLCDPDGGDYILHRATSENFDLVILDNLSVLATISDENSASAMDPVLDLLMRLKQAGVATLLLHHSSKSGDNYRGSTKLVTTFEVIVGLKAAAGAVSRHAAAFDMQFDKFRALRNGTIRGTTAWLEADADGVMKWQHDVSEEDQLKNVINEVRTLVYPTQKALAKAIGVSVGTVSNLKTRAISKGMITEQEWESAFKAARNGEPVRPNTQVESIDVAVH